MARYINADSLLDYLHSLDGYELISLKAIRQIIDSEPTADVREVINSSWIPVAERLPEVDAQCIISLDAFIDFATFTGEDFHAEWCDYYLTEVTAWVPEPEPYRGDK